MIRFHRDENISPAVADGLRQRGIDVTTTMDAGLASASDQEQLEHARVESRILVTTDTDFLRLHARGVPHAGIAFYQQGARSIGEIIDSLEVMHGCVTPSEIQSRVEFL